MYLFSCIRATVTLGTVAAFVPSLYAMALPRRGEFSSQLVQDGKLRYVRNSGVCETTPGVEQLSGYVDVGKNMSMWFWFFEARNSPETAPFTLWLNGGPGCSSMIGLFQENGPCQVNPDNQTTVLNPYSWNNVSNVIYIDQPIGTGFSYGTVDVNRTSAAAPAIWTAFQLLFESNEFAKYQSREFVFATESYGGFYGPEFVSYFNEQNAKIANSAVQGVPINVSALMINNGWYDALIQTESWIDFVTDAPGYGQLSTAEVLAQLNESYYGSGGCRERELACYAAGESAESNEICSTTAEFCTNNVFNVAVGSRHSDDLRQNASSPALFPTQNYVSFLQNETIAQRIGAEVPYAPCSLPVYVQFNGTGDNARSLLPRLSALADSRTRILIWAGDADINCNWLGGHAVVLAMDWYGNETLHNTPFTNLTINGKPAAAIQNVDNFSFARVYEAGHEVPAFQPEVALELFSQVIRREQLHSVP